MEFIDYLKAKLPDNVIDEHHFIQHPDQDGNPGPPRTMTITFKDLDSAEKNLKEDTLFYLGIIHAKNKKKTYSCSTQAMFNL